MPYLPENHKYEIEKVCDLQHTAEYIASKDTNDFAGAINYINFVILKKRIKHDGGTYKRYLQFAVWAGSMFLCVLEAYRRIIGPYEDAAISKNGDIDD